MCSPITPAQSVHLSPKMFFIHREKWKRKKKSLYICGQDILSKAGAHLPHSRTSSLS